MRQAIQTLSSLLAAAAILYAGNGLQTTLLAVRANLEGFGLMAIGLLLSAYFFGFILGCRFTPRLVKRAGHIRAFAALASVASASALLHALAVEPKIWMLFRAITGFCFAGLTMIIESWINEKATNQNRGRVLAFYRVVDLSAVMAGQMLLTLADPMGFVLFALLSILISLALVPVALTTSTAPRPIEVARLNVRRLWQVAPLAAIGSLGVGLANGAFWAVAPVFVLHSGYDTNTVAVFMSTVIFAGAIAQWPLGFLSDRIDRRRVIVAVMVLGLASSGFLAWAGQVSEWMLLAGGALFGFCAMPMFGLSAAHANDYAQPNEFVETSASLLLLYGIGAVIGPAVAPLVMSTFGSWSLFAYTAAIHGLTAVYGLYRLTRRAPAPEFGKEHFVPLVETTPVMFELDPRGPQMNESPAEPEAKDQQSE